MFLEALGFKEGQQDGEQVLVPPVCSDNRSTVRATLLRAGLLVEQAKLFPPSSDIGNPNKVSFFGHTIPAAAQISPKSNPEELNHYWMLGSTPWMGDNDIAEIHLLLKRLPAPPSDVKRRKVISALLAIGIERGKEFFANLAGEYSEAEQIIKEIHERNTDILPPLPSSSSLSHAGHSTLSGDVPVDRDDIGEGRTLASPPPLPANVRPTGLVNQGSTCYINSALQLLFSLRPFWSRLLKLPATRPETNDVPLTQAISLLFELREVTFRLASGFFFPQMSCPVSSF